VKVSRAALLMAAVFAAAWMLEAVRPTAAMPPFAQSYGMDCQVCHSVVPGLNAYGRYVQRTGYASLDAATIHRADPLWIGESPFYDTMDPAEPHKVQFGNLALHAAGFIGRDFTFHAHQWLWQFDQPGGTDTMWITYNNLLHRDGHLFVGKIEAPAPSPISQWFDLQGFLAPSYTVGEHAYPFGSNGWGTKFAYTRNWLTAEVAYLGPSGDLNTATDFGLSNGTDKRLQWRLVDALGYHPLEIGVYGGTGEVLVSDGNVDRYHGQAGYAEIDPTNGLPGALVIYQTGFDSHPVGGVNGTANSKGYSAELFEPFANHHAMFSVRDEYADDGMGTTTRQGNIDLAVLASHQVNDGLANGWIVNLENYFAQGSTPGWRGQLWYVTTVGHLR